MNTHWLTLPKERRIEILNQATAVTGLPASVIEKDWWVTLCLNAAFSLQYSANIVFKGGTSLSKSWSLIDRFSEDIDLAIDRTFFGFDEDISKSQIKKLRKQSCAFISTQFLNDLKQTITDWGAATEWKILAQQAIDSDKDPQILEVHYDSVLEPSEYLPQRVLIEVGSRSLMEPAEMREINSILSTTFHTQSFASASFAISTVLPQRTFLEKIFLLHEEFSHPLKKFELTACQDTYMTWKGYRTQNMARQHFKTQHFMTTLSLTDQSSIRSEDLTTTTTHPIKSKLFHLKAL
jgi:hypothetical protein